MDRLNLKIILALLPLLFLFGATESYADLFNSGSSYSKMYESQMYHNFNYRPYVQNRVPEKKYNDKREYGYVGQYKKDNNKIQIPSMKNPASWDAQNPNAMPGRGFYAGDFIAPPANSKFIYDAPTP